MTGFLTPAASPEGGGRGYPGHWLDAGRAQADDLLAEFGLQDRAYVMRLGKIAASGSASEVSSAYDLKALYLGG